MEDKKKFLWSMIVLIIFFVCGTSIYAINKLNLRSITATKACLDIFLSKEKTYFTEITNNRYIYNEKENTCLMLSLYTDASNGNVRMVVIDMIKDEPLFLYTLKTGTTTDDTYHLTKDEALVRIRSYGFFIF